MVFAWEKEPLEVYRQRRSALAERLKDGVVVVFGAREPDGPDATQGFKQNDNLYYLTGWTEPGAMALITPVRHALFLPPRNAMQERWTGPKLAPGDRDAAARTGFDAVLSTAAFDDELRKEMAEGRKLYTVLAPARDAELSASMRAAWTGKASIADAAPEIARLRQVKSPSELALMEKAIRASMDAHLEAMRALRPGMMEHELAALMKYTFERQGCERPAYAPIVASGFYSTVLHYSANDRRMQAGEVVVLDVGGEYSGYAADITRTLPVSGRFTPRQREIYEIVLGAQKAAIAAVRPGMTISRQSANSIHRIAYEYINSHGHDGRGDRLGKCFIHGTSHFLGLHVHDAGAISRPLEPGMVITVEPGIYLPEENLGVRIEDIVLVTENGARVLTQALPKEPDQIERAMNSAR